MNLPYGWPLHVAHAMVSLLAVVLLQHRRRQQLHEDGTNAKREAGKEVAVDGNSCSNSTDAQSNDSTKPIPVVHVYFGSQTGTAESFAQTIATKLSETLDIDSMVIDLESFDPKYFISCKWVVMALATYDEGCPTDSAMEFYKWISESAPDNCLSNMKYTIMGLGNKQYEQFNAMARRTDKYMKRLGAQSICARGEGDDDADIDADFAAWCEVMLKAFSTVLSTGGNDGEPKSTGVTNHVTSHKEKTEKFQKWKQSKKLHFDIEFHRYGANPVNIIPVEDAKPGTLKGYFGAQEVEVADVYELRQCPYPEQGKSTHNLKLRILADSNLSYNSADTLDVYPVNPPRLVSWFVERMDAEAAGITLEHIVHYKKRVTGGDIKKEQPLPPSISLKELLQSVSDLTALPPKANLLEFCHFLEDEEEREALKKLLSDKHNNEWKAYIKEYGYTLREFIEVFMTSAKFDVGAFVQLLSKQRARPYTICSSPQGDHIEIAVSLVKKEMPLLKKSLTALKNIGLLPILTESLIDKFGHKKRTYEGLCSSFLCAKSLLSKHLKVTVKPSNFKLPKDPSTPIVMVGTGAGVAPFRAFWQDIQTMEVKRKAVLFFGCCYENEDWIYKQEMLEASAGEAPVLTALFTSFSRQQKHKMYVQHKVAEEQELLFQLLEEGGVIYICGGTRMGRSVLDCLKTIAAERGHTKKYVEELIAGRRIIQELWG